MATRRKKVSESASPQVDDLRYQYENTIELFQERISQLELSLEDFGWTRMIGESNQEFSRQGLRLIAQLARINFLKNPLIQRGVKVTADYVFGQGLTIKSSNEDVDAVLQHFWQDTSNRAQITAQQQMIEGEHELEIKGNLFFVFFINHVTGRVQVRLIPLEEIEEIYTDPEDRKQPQYYKRQWYAEGIDPVSGQVTVQEHHLYYPDWQFHPRVRPPMLGNIPVSWDTPIYHIKVGGLPDMKFGVSEIYAALDWAKAYKDFLEDWATIVRAYSRFAWQLTTSGGAKGIAAAKAKLNTTLNLDQLDYNPPPVTGSTFIPGNGTKIEPIKTSGATTSAEDGRRLMLMVAAVMGLPESFFGDVSVGTLATAKSLDRPTELKMRNRQMLWADVFINILRFVVVQAASASQGPLIDGKVVLEQEEDGSITILDPQGEMVGIEVTFPSILEHDVTEQVGAVVNAATLAGHPAAGVIDQQTITRLLCQALDIKDVDGVLQAVEDAQAAAQAEEQRQAKMQADNALAIAKAKAASAPAPTNPQAAQPTPPEAPEDDSGIRPAHESSAMLEAAAEIRDAINRLKERYGSRK